MMDFFLPFKIKPLPEKISYSDKIMMIGSCFSFEIGMKLQQLKFEVLQNPTGIIYHPLMIAELLDRCSLKKEFTNEDIFESRGLFHSWSHHSSFSGVGKNDVLQNINQLFNNACDFIKTADWLIITPATAFGYWLLSQNKLVANCHKMPSGMFEKQLAQPGEISNKLGEAISGIQQLNPGIKILFTISPVKHLRDGIVENNLSKSCVIKAVHDLLPRIGNSYYFPAYEILTDELRDYRFYKKDFAHPNELAISYIFERFIDFAFDKSTTTIMKSVGEIVNAVLHKPQIPGSPEANRFIQNQLEKIAKLSEEFPSLDFSKEKKIFPAQYAGTGKKQHL